MSRSKLTRAYDCMTPGPAAKARMRAGLMARAGARRGWGALRRVALFAAVNALAVGLFAAAYRAGWLGERQDAPPSLSPAPAVSAAPAGQEEAALSLEELSIGVRKSRESGEPAYGEFISLQGRRGSPEYEACLAWHEFLEGCDPDGGSSSGGPLYSDGAHDAYRCRTAGMAEKIDALCAQYGLSLCTASIDLFSLLSEQELFQAAGTGDFLRPGAEAGLALNWSYAFDGGGFQAEGSVRLGGGLLNFQMLRLAKGYFTTAVLNVGSVKDYLQWTYTASDGARLLLAAGPDKALLAAERERSFVVVNFPVSIPAEDLETVADLFSFAAIP